MKGKKLGLIVLSNEKKLERYAAYLIEKIAVEVDEVIIGCREGLEESCRNVGFNARIVVSLPDAQCGYAQFLRRINRENYSEIIMCNDNIFGPFYELTPIMTSMEQQTPDFWGMLEHSAGLTVTGEQIPAHIDSDFLVLGEKILAWGGFAALLEQPEADWAVYLEDRGFCGAAYATTAAYDFPKGQNNIDYSYYYGYELIKDQHYPFLKTDNFAFSSGLDYSHRDSLRKAFRYIEEKLDYDTDFIWEHILLHYNIADIRESLQLYFLLDSQAADCRKCGQQFSAAVFMHLFYGDLLDETLEYVKNIPSDMDIYITTHGDAQIAYVEEKLKAWGRAHYHVMEAGARGRDAAALLVVCRKYILKYDIICFVHDKKTSGGRGPRMIGDAFRNLVFDNTVSSENYINNVLGLFAENPRLGFLTPVCPILKGYQGYSGGLGNEWTFCYEAAVELAERLGLDVVMSRDKEPVAMSNVFWCRVEALSGVFSREWSVDDFPEEPLPEDGTINHAIERIYPYVAQNAGFYTGVLLEKNFAENYICNLVFSIRSLLQVIRKRLSFGLSDDITEALALLGDNYALYEKEHGLYQMLLEENDKKDKYIGELTKEAGLARLYAEDNARKDKYIEELTEKVGLGQLYMEDNVKKDKYIEELTEKVGLGQLYMEENAKKEKYIEELTQEAGLKQLYVEENAKKEKYIEELKQKIAVYERKVQEEGGQSYKEQLKIERCKVSILRMCRKYSGKVLYLYGAGKLAGRTIDLLDEMEIACEGVIVSSISEGQTEFRGHSLISMDMLDSFSEESVILVALNSQHCAEVLPALDKMGCTYFCPWESV